jgi:hypothetical protein
MLLVRTPTVALPASRTVGVALRLAMGAIMLEGAGGVWQATNSARAKYIHWRVTLCIVNGMHSAAGHIIF